MKMKLEEAGKRFLERTDCPRLLKVSKRLEGRLDLRGGNPCRCECKVGDTVQSVVRVVYRALLRFRSAKPCDETGVPPLLPDGTDLWLEGLLTLRQEICEATHETALIGRNAGKYTIHRYSPDEDVMTGPFCGTEGFLSTGDGERRCCAPFQGVGSFCGDGMGRLADWSLCVSYHSMMRGLDPQKICDSHSIEMTLDLDGVLIGPCRTIEGLRAQSKPRRNVSRNRRT